jgi:hypothetical protein
MPTTALHRIIASTPETVDSALLELEGTPAPFEEANPPGEIRVDRDDHANVGRTGSSHHQSYGRVM